MFLSIHLLIYHDHDRRQVTKEEGQAFANKHGLIFLETSAKTSANVEDAFVQTARHIYGHIQSGIYDVTNEAYGIRVGMAAAPPLGAYARQNNQQGGAGGGKCC